MSQTADHATLAAPTPRQRLDNAKVLAEIVVAMPLSTADWQAPTYLDTELAKRGLVLASATPADHRNAPRLTPQTLCGAGRDGVIRQKSEIERHPVSSRTVSFDPHAGSLIALLDKAIAEVKSSAERERLITLALAERHAAMHRADPAARSNDATREPTPIKRFPVPERTVSYSADGGAAMPVPFGTPLPAHDPRKLPDIQFPAEIAPRGDAS